MMRAMQLRILAAYTIAVSWAPFAMGQGWAIEMIDGGSFVGGEASLSHDELGRITVSYRDYLDIDGDGDPEDLRLWHDDNGNGLFDAGEARTIDSVGQVGWHTSLCFEPSGLATVAYYDKGNGDLKLWHDADGDFAPDAGETQTIDSTGDVGKYAALAFDTMGRATVLYHDSDNNDLRLWHDVNGNFAFDLAGDSLTVVDLDNADQDVGLAFDTSGRLTASYRSGSSLRVWHDANGDVLTDPAEVQTIVEQSSGPGSVLRFDGTGNATVVYRQSQPSSGDVYMYVWHDANGDFAYDDGEIHEIDEGNLTEKIVFALDPVGRATVAYESGQGGLGGWYVRKTWLDADGDFSVDLGEIHLTDVGGEPMALKHNPSGELVIVAFTRLASGWGFGYWHDTSGDLVVDDGEIHFIEGPPADVGELSRVAFDPSGHMVVSYWDRVQTDYRVWVDADDSLSSDSGEIHIGDALRLFAFDSLGRFCWSRSVIIDDPPLEQLQLWCDSDGDFLVDSDEVNVIASVESFGPPYHFGSPPPAFAFDPMGHATVVFSWTEDWNSYETRVWHDADGDLAGIPGEIEIIDFGRPLPPALAFDSSGHATLAYFLFQGNELRLWHDIDGDFAFDSGELTIIHTQPHIADSGDYPSLAFDSSGHPTVAFGARQSSSDTDTRIWHDADSDFAYDPGEIHVVDDDLGSSIVLRFDSAGRATVAYATRPSVDYEVMLWHDTDADFVPESGELQKVLTAEFAEGGASPFPSFVIREIDQLVAIAHHDGSTQSLMLAVNRDWDDDGLVLEDNCPLVANPGQEESDGDGVGDVCDVCPGFDDTTDTDGDSVPDGCDACPGFDDNVDVDIDGVPDGCDECPFDNPDDTDGDGVCDSDDPCPLDNPDDSDVDGICNSDDNCPADYNPGQENTDSDDVGDVCDPCTDVDGDGWGQDVGNGIDCTNGSDPDCDDTGSNTTDLDIDNVCDPNDNCQADYNPGQEDTDSDDVGDVCDLCTDVDGDGWGQDVGNGINCPNGGDPDCDDAGSNTTDPDVDNACDPNDNCVLHNPDQLDCQPNGVGDVCDVDPSDPDGNGEVSPDLNSNGIPDECDCILASAPEPEVLDLEFNPESQKIRYLSFSAGETARGQAIRVTFSSVPSPYDHWNGTELWVQQPQEYCENAGAVQDDPCPTNVGGLPSTGFWGAVLGCDPYWTDWTAYDVVHVWNEGIVPGGEYDVQVIDSTCSLGLEDDYSDALILTQSGWADLIQDCTTTPCKAPDGSTGIVDVTAILDKWKNLPGNVKKVRADIEGSPAGDHRLPDQAINITDVTYCLGAFLGDTYPPPGFPPPSDPPVCP